MRPVEISDGELLLRRARMSEARQLMRAVQASQPELVRFLPWATPDYDVDAARAFLEFARDEERQERGLHLSIFEQESGELVGGMGLMLRPVLGHGEVGYWTHSDRAGRGIATQAAGLIMDHGFRQLGLRRITLVCDLRNRASRRIAEKLGMRREGRLREYLVSEGRARDHWLYAILKREFKH